MPRGCGENASPRPSNYYRAARLAIIATVPWVPAYVFEQVTFYSGTTRQAAVYGVLTGLRLEVDVVSFASGGILIAYLMRPRLAVAQIFASTVIVWTMFYRLCETFRSADGLLHSACYHPGPDGLAGYRLAMMMFSLGMLPSLVRAAPHLGLLEQRFRAIWAIFAGIVLSVVAGWFPLTAWFSGASYLALFLPIQATVLFGVPEIACGILAARIGRSVKLAAAAGTLASLYFAASMWTELCPGCNRTMLVFIVPLWGLFSAIGGFLELGSSIPRRKILGFAVPGTVHLPILRRIGLAAVITVSLWTVVAYPLWAPSVLYATDVSSDQDPLYLGLPTYRPYVAGYYNSTQYRICCLEIGVSFSQANPLLISSGNFLMAGMGVQSPNCCIDGWDFGWRADVFLRPDGSLLVSGSTWETCDANANCGGHFWQHLRYHSQQVISPPTLSSRIFLRMMWEAGKVNWYYNHTGVPWQRFGTFTPDWREGTYFDIGVVGSGHGNDPYHDAYFFQFGVASKTPVADWHVLLLYPSFQFQGSWRLMEKAAVIQGDLSYWKVAYRWGGAAYPGVTARARALDNSLPSNMVEFVNSGGFVRNSTPLW